MKTNPSSFSMQSLVNQQSMYRIIYFLIFSLSLGVAKSQNVIPFKLTSYGHIIVEVSLDGTHRGNFIFDTGSGCHIIGTKFLDKVKNTSTYAGVGTGFRHNGDRVDLDAYRLKSISLGSLTEQNPYVGYFPALDQYGIDGLISAKLYENNPITIDFAKKEIRIEDEQSILAIAKNEKHMPLDVHKMTDRFLDLFIVLQLNDSLACEAEFDTGSGFANLLLNPFYMELLKIDTASSAVKTKVETDNISLGVNKSYETSILSLSLKELDEIRVDSADVIFKERLIYDGLVSSQLFKDRAITIDIPGKRLFVHAKKN